MYKCKICGKEFETCQSLGGHVVSIHKKENLGSILNKKKNEEEYLKNPKLCENCNKIIPYERIRRDKSVKFCSRSCSAKTSNRKRSKSGQFVSKDTKINLYELNKIKEKIFCANCGKELKHIHNNKFCSQSCLFDYKKKKYIKDWFENGKLPIMDGGKPNKTIREYILREQNNRCAICGMENVWNGKPLNFVLDHIDGNSSNSSRENLRLICHNCDSQTETYKSKNKGNGRFFRRQRMLDGKSF